MQIKFNNNPPPPFKLVTAIRELLAKAQQIDPNVIIQQQDNFVGKVFRDSFVVLASPLVRTATTYCVWLDEDGKPEGSTHDVSPANFKEV